MSIFIVNIYTDHTEVKYPYDSINLPPCNVDLKYTFTKSIQNILCRAEILDI